MKKILKLARGIFFGLAIFIATKNYAQTTQVFSLNTGVNSLNAVLPIGTIDPKWQVKFPGGTSFQNTFVANASSWNIIFTNPAFTCGRWIAPEPLNTTGIGSTITGPGLYTYRMNFTPNNCNILSAKIVFNFTLADNTLKNFKVNSGFTFNYPIPFYTCSPDIAQACWNPVTPYTVNLNPSNFVSGNNTIDFTVDNASQSSGFTITGLALCAYLEITYENPLAPTISGASSFCLGSPITFNGTDGPNATASNYQWNIQECTSTGIPINPINSWISPMYAGTPGAFTFPTLPFIECGKYYLVKLNVANNCYINSISKIVFIKCPPVVRFVRNQTICKGTCVTLFATQVPGYTYNWYSFLDEPTFLGSGSQLVVCPNQTTNYSCIITDPATGCSVTRYVTITVENIDPNFSVNVLTSNTNYMTIGATPNQVTGLPATLGYLWIVEELNSSNNTVWSVVNPSCWWNFPGTPTNSFSGILGLTQTFNSSCFPSIGQFKYNTTYRITRGVWSENCPYKQSSITLSYSQRGLVVTNDPTAKDVSYLINSTNNKTGQINYKKLFTNENTFSVYPNPSSSIINVDYMLPENTTGKIAITDVLGRIIESIELSETNNISTFDLSSFQNGIYFVNLFVNSSLVKTEKVILSK
jgi:hypothetical protein